MFSHGGQRPPQQQMPERFYELLEQLKSEYEARAHNHGMYKLQREDYERRCMNSDDVGHCA